MGLGWRSTREHPQCSRSCGDRAQGSGTQAGRGASAPGAAFLACEFPFFFKKSSSSYFFFFLQIEIHPFSIFTFYFMSLFVFFFLTTRAGHAASYLCADIVKGNTYFRKARHIMW